MAWTDWLIPDLEWQSLTPELVVLLFALLAPLVALWDTDRKGMQQFTFIGLAGAFILTLGSLMGWHADIPGIGFDFTLEYIDNCAEVLQSGTAQVCDVYAIDASAQLFKLIFLGVALVATIGMGRPLRGSVEKDWGEFYSLLLFATLGMMVVASARELIILLIGIEIASLSSYLLSGFARDQRGAEAALKYFVIGAISSGMTLFAISLLYGAAGTTRIADLSAAIQSGGDFSAIGIVASILLLGGLGFKISSVPFHAWAPDVYHGSPAPVAGVLAAASKAMGFAAVFQVFLVGLAGVAPGWELAVALIAVASMFVGNLIAIRQTSIARMLAFSSIAQAGYLLIAVAVAGAMGGFLATGEAAKTASYALTGGFLHLIVNAAMKLGAFLILGVLLWRGLPDTIEGWRGLGRKAPLLAFTMTLFLLSMAGIPPLGGFTSKFVLFSGAVDAAAIHREGWLLWLAVAAVVNSAISLFYYVRLMRSMYVESDEDGEHPLDIPFGVKTAVVACAAVILAVGFYPQPFLEAAQDAANALLLRP